jgi:transposase
LIRPGTQEAAVGRPPIYSAEKKLEVVMMILRGEVTQSEIGRRLELSQTTISKWLKVFTEAGMEGLSRGNNPPPSATAKQIADLQAQVDDLTSAIGEAYVELRVWRKKGALYPGTRT